MINMVVVDVETSGLSPYKHSILSIGAVDFANPTNQFYGECQIFPGSEVDFGALKVNGFKQSELNDPLKQSLGELVYNYIGWLGKLEDITIAGQNPTFDRDFLQQSARKCKISYEFGKRTVDLHALAFAKRLELGFPPILKNNSTNLYSDVIMNFVGLPAEPRPHIGINGARYELEAFYRLIYGKNALEEFTQYKVPEYLLKA
ncbi:MAG: hypothetical protein OHK0017_09620 [Patescibacteria group bacterium]